MSHLIGAEHQTPGNQTSHPYSQCERRGCTDRQWAADVNCKSENPNMPGLFCNVAGTSHQTHYALGYYWNTPCL